MVQSPENRSRNGHVLIWEQPGLNGDPNTVQKPSGKYRNIWTFRFIINFLLIKWLLAGNSADGDRPVVWCR